MSSVFIAWLEECERYRSTPLWRPRKRRRIWQHIQYLERKLHRAGQ